MVLDAFGALGIAAAAASLQGFHPSAGWGAPSPDFSTCGVPGSPGFHPPWGIPLPSLGLSAAALGLTTASGNSAYLLNPKAEAACAWPPLAFRGSTLSGTVPCASSFKELGSWLASFETAGP